MGKPVARTLFAALVALTVVAVVAIPAQAAPSIADLSVTVSGNPSVVAPPGGTVFYTVALTNNGPAAAPATLTDSSAGGGSFFSASSTIPSGCTAPANGTVNPVISCSFTLLTAGQTVTLVVAVKSTTTPGTQSNAADAAVPPNTLNVIDGNDSNNHAGATTPVKALADIGVTVAGPSGTVLADTTVTYTVTATNNGPSASDVTLNTAASGGGTLDLGASTIPAGCSAPANGTANPSIACSFGAVAAGTTRQVVVGIHTTSSPGTQVESATVSTPATTIDNNAANNSASSTTSVQKVADLAVSLAGPVGPVLSGTVATYTATVTNNGPSSSDAAFTDAFTGGGTLVLASSSLPASCTAPSDGTVDPTITCSFSNVASGGTRVVSVGIRTAYGSGTETDAASVSAPGNVVDPTAGNNTASVGTTVQTLADAAVTITGTPSTVSPAGGGVLYIVKVTNNGPSPSDVVVTDVSGGGGALALGTSIIPAVCSAPADGTVDPTISCTFTQLASGETVQIRVSIKTSTTPGTQTNAASVSVPQNVTDNNSANNSASISTSVINDPNSSTAYVPSNGSLTFKASTLTATNAAGGVVASLANALAGGSVCGAGPCDNGIGVGFDSNPDLQGTVQVLIDLGRGNPCRGIGAGSACADLYMRKFGIVTKLPMCSAAPAAKQCILSVGKNSPNITWLVRLDSTDPEFLPPLNQKF